LRRAAHQDVQTVGDFDGLQLQRGEVDVLLRTRNRDATDEDQR
jgi:hypothetical protein